MFNPRLEKFRPNIKALKVGATLVIPWSEFLGPRPKTRKERAVSDGTRSYILMPVDDGIEMKRIE